MNHRDAEDTEGISFKRLERKRIEGYLPFHLTFGVLRAFAV
jgi:hypothetical protein